MLTAYYGKTYKGQMFWQIWNFLYLVFYFCWPQVGGFWAAITNSYDYMVVMVKKSMYLAKTVVAAAASFRVAETKEDCEFPTPTENMDLFYFYSIIVVAPSLLWFLFVCAICVPFALICRQPKNHLLKVNRKNKILDTKNYMPAHLIKSF